MTKPVVTQATTRHQMKDMDIIFPLIPQKFFVGSSSFETTASQSQAFFQKVEHAEN